MSGALHHDKSRALLMEKWGRSWLDPEYILIQCDQLDVRAYS